MRSDLSDLLRAVAQPSSSDLGSVWEGYRRALDGGSTPFRAAVQVASSVDRLGLAFAAGYSAALQTLVPDAVLPCALCVTEAGGAHPRAIESTLQASEADAAYTLNGLKTFVTFGNLAQTLIVAVRAGEQADGKPELAVVRIPADRDGVSLQELPPITFVPEVPHAQVEFRDVSVDASERLSGDGYLKYVKPFRTIEDIHVYGSAVAYLLGLGQRTKAPHGFLAELVAVLVTLERLRESAPLDPTVHIALHGVSQHLDRLFSSNVFASIWDAASAEERERWERDRKLLQVASTAREARFRKAATRHWA
jgi:acyl-CoA dehydrogenase